MRPHDAEDSLDRIGIAVQLGRRLQHFRVLTEHPMFHQIYGRLIGGQSTERIAAWLLSSLPRSDSLGSDSTTQEALARRLRRFRAALPDGAVLSQGYLDRRFRSLDAGIDVLAELDALIRYQKERLEILAEREQDSRAPVEAQRREVETLAELLVKRNTMATGLGLIQIAQLEQMKLASHASHTIHSEPTWGDVVHEHPELIPQMASFFDAVDEAAMSGRGVFTGRVEDSASLRWAQLREAKMNGSR